MHEKIKKRAVTKAAKAAISLILAIAITGANAGISLMAESVDSRKTSGKNTSIAGRKKEDGTDENLMGEEIAEQIANGTYDAKLVESGSYYDVYKEKDGSRVLAIYNEDIRYENENGKLVDYDSTLVPIEEEQELFGIKLPGTGNNREKVCFHADNSTAILENNIQNSISNSKSLEQEECASRYLYRNASGDSMQYIPEILSNETPLLLGKDEYQIAIIPNASLACVQLKDGHATYSSEDGKMEYIYQSKKNGVKENVVLKERPSTNMLTYEYVLEGVTMELDEQTNQIFVCDENSGERVASITSPFMYDSTVENISYKIDYSLEEHNGVWTVTEILDEAFLNAESTKYPVTVDPSFTWDCDSGLEIGQTRSTQSDGAADRVLDCSEQICIGELGKGYKEQVNIKVPGIRELVYGKYINFGAIYLQVSSVSGTPVIGVYPIMEEWSKDTVTWNTRPSVSDTCIALDSGNFQVDRTYVVWLRTWLEKIAKGETENDYGVALYNVATEDWNHLSFYGDNYEYKRPSCIISYIDPEDISAAYDGSFQINADYDSQNHQINLTWDKYNDSVSKYIIFTRNGDGKYQYRGVTTEQGYTVDVSDYGNIVDIRVMAVEAVFEVAAQFDKNYLSNIITFEKQSGINTDEEGNEIEDITYVQTTMDTDGDGLEDGYEIWDFKTKWNEKDEEGNYILDSDGDGFPDDYEVFMLGTDPAVANEIGKDSDGDGWSDIKEYQKGTAPWLVDSDFDGIIDRQDAYPRKTNKSTNQMIASNAQTQIGKYDTTVTDTIDGITYTSIVNIYDGTVKEVNTDYDTGAVGKTEKYFYNTRKQKTAMISLDGEKTENIICITYTYDESGNVIDICDQSSLYSMKYSEEGKMTELKIGDKVFYNLQLNTKTGEPSSQNNTDEENQKEIIETYGNAQTIRRVITEYNLTDNEESSAVSGEEIYYNNDENKSYKLEYNSNGEVVKLFDYTISTENPVVYSYDYSDGTRITRNDGFEINKQSIDAEEFQETIEEDAYTFQDISEDTLTYTTKTTEDTSDENKIVYHTELFNGSEVFSHDDMESKITKNHIYSDIFDENIISTVKTQNNNTEAEYVINTYSGEKTYVYIYDKNGNIVKISLDGNNIFEYSYDGHGRLVSEKDYIHLTEHEYLYSATGNIDADITYAMDTSGKRVTDDEHTAYFVYDNKEWNDQLTEYDGQKLEYDGLGNPLKYRDGMEFSWNHGNDLESIRFADGSTVEYRYDDRGLRISKETMYAVTNYEWDGMKLIRETVTDKNSEKVYDVWYLYDGNNRCIGFEYSYLNAFGIKNWASIYYVRDAQGNIIALTDYQGKEIVAYSYDAWGNLTDKICYEGGEMAYVLNHMKYRGYYCDEESGLYYLKNRYYDSVIHRFVNPDDVQYFGYNESVFMYNLYIYCANNPVNNADPNGNWFYTLSDYNIWYTFRGIYIHSSSVERRFRNHLKYNCDKLIKKQQEENRRNARNPYNYCGSYIYNQKLEPYASLKCGANNKIRDRGCGIIAIYNLLKKLGKYVYFPAAILQCEMNDLMVMGAYLGTSPRGSAKFFKAYGVNYKAYATKKYFLKNADYGDIYVITVMNNGKPFSEGMHTYMVAKEGSYYRGYNYDNSSKHNFTTSSFFSLEDIFKEDVFYYGYVIKA